MSCPGQVRVSERPTDGTLSLQRRQHQLRIVCSPNSRSVKASPGHFPLSKSPFRRLRLNDCPVLLSLLQLQKPSPMEICRHSCYCGGICYKIDIAGPLNLSSPPSCVPQSWQLSFLFPFSFPFALFFTSSSRTVPLALDCWHLASP